VHEQRRRALTRVQPLQQLPCDGCIAQQVHVARRRPVGGRPARPADAVPRPLAPAVAAALYSDAKVANREIRVWHFVIENGY
jgi:hypothetical protein